MSKITKFPGISRIGVVPSKAGVIRAKSVQSIDDSVIDRVNSELREKSDRQRANNLIAYALADELIAGPTYAEKVPVLTKKRR